MIDRRALLAAAACSALTASAHVARAQPSGRFAQAARYSAERGGVALLVARHGVILGEDYPGGGGGMARWPIGAGTRMFMPLLYASLAADRILSLDDPAALTIGDWGAHPLKSTISIRSLLNGTSGIAFGASPPGDLFAAIALEPSDPPGVRFAADNAAYLVLTEIARRKLLEAGRDGDPARYLTERTLAPIGCVPMGWTRWADGAPRFDDGAIVSAMGWAQAGELIRREGVWRASLLADGSALREALRGSFAEQRAGFGVWLAAPGRFARGEPSVDSDLWRASSPAPIDLAMAAGAAGQRLFLSPSEGLVIVRQTNGEDVAAQWSDAQFLSLVWRGL